MLAKIIKSHEDSNSGHNFEVGEIVELLEVNKDSSEFLFTNGNVDQYLFADEFEALDESEENEDMPFANNQKAMWLGYEAQECITWENLDQVFVYNPYYGELPVYIIQHNKRIKNKQDMIDAVKNGKWHSTYYK